MIHVLVLGASAGGGFPQWNSNSEACRRARAGDPAARPATQASIAISADGEQWFLVNAAPDLREQINRQTQLHPKEGLRSSPIAGVVLTNGDVDALAGLLHLRERTPLALYGHPRILAILEQNPIFRVLAPDVVDRIPFALDETLPLCDRGGKDSTLRVTSFALPGKVALFMEDATKGESFGTREGDTVGLEITDADGAARVLYVANCAAITEALKARCQGVDLLFFDGTLWRDDEMITSGEGEKTGRRMGHISMSGPDGSIAALQHLSLGRKIFIHINNTNPALLVNSAERGELEAAGWEVAYDGMEITLQ
ncbi:MAG: pyrroloquinoline quinone biosynthesis protein PqqB [Acidiferrobacterales bacterium]